MATTIDATNLNPCQVVQAGIETAFLRHPGAQPFGAGAYDALVSDINRSSFIQAQSASTGGASSTLKNAKVQVTYVPASCDEDAGELDRCEFPDTESAFKTANLTLDNEFTWGFKLTEDEYRDMCEGDINGVYGKMLLAKYQQAKKQFNKKIVDALVLLPGNYPTNGADSLTTPISLPIVTSAGTYLPTGFGLLKSIYNSADIYDDPIIVGGRGIPELALNSLRYSAPNTVPGYTVGTGLPNLYMDGTLNDAFGDGDNHLLTWAPGAIQLLEYYQNAGNWGWAERIERNGVQAFKEQYTTIVTPDGIQWDFSYKFDCGVHYYKFSKVFGVAPMPSDAFGSCRDYNYILNFLATCGDLECATIEAALASASTSS